MEPFSENKWLGLATVGQSFQNTHDMLARRLIGASLRQPVTRWALPAAARFTTWTHVPLGPADPILGLTVAFKNDTAPNKVIPSAHYYYQGESI